MSAAQVKQHVHDTLSAIKISDLAPATKPVVVVKPTENLSHAFNDLISNGILSAPVENKSSGYVGFLDMRDLVAAVVAIHKVDAKRFERSIELGDVVAQLTVDDTHNTEPAKPTNVLSVWTPAYMAKLNPIKSVRTSESLLQVCKTLAGGQHRVAVMNDDGVIVRIISQSWLMTELAERLQSLEKVPISEFGITPKYMFSCQLTEAAIHAFQMMDKHKVSGVPVVDSEGRLVGQVEGGALHEFLDTRNVKTLTQEIREFVGEANLSLEIGASMSFKIDSPLSDVLSTFARSKSHRLYMVDDNQKLVGVASLKDVLAAVLD